MASFAGARRLGAVLDFAPTTDQGDGITLGERVTDQLGNEFVYVQAAEALGLGVPVDFTSAFVASVSDSGDPIFAVVRGDGTAFAADEYGWVQTRGIVPDAQVAASTAAGDPLASVADSNGDFFVVIDVDEAGADTATAGGLSTRAYALEAESSGVADILIP